jgi:hypothetical protein
MCSASFMLAMERTYERIRNLCVLTAVVALGLAVLSHASHVTHVWHH